MLNRDIPSKIALVEEVDRHCEQMLGTKLDILSIIR